MQSTRSTENCKTVLPDLVGNLVQLQRCSLVTQQTAQTEKSCSIVPLHADQPNFNISTSTSHSVICYLIWPTILKFMLTRQVLVYGLANLLL